MLKLVFCQEPRIFREMAQNIEPLLDVDIFLNYNSTLGD
jgi:hypothetical protein